MPSTYTNTGIELIADGEQTGAWGDTTNTNLQILNRLTSEAGTVTLAGTTHTLTLTSGALSEGQYAALIFGGSPTGTNTVTISPNTARRVYYVKNTSGQTVVLTQGSGGNVTVVNGAEAVVYCDGGGSTAAVVDITTTYMRAANNLSDLGDAATALTNLGLTATAAELNKLDGATLDIAAVTAVAAEVNVLDGITATTAELNILDGVTATTAELNILDGVTATTAELNNLNGLNQTLATTDSPTFAGLTTSNISDGTASVGTEYVVNGSAKAWANLDQTVTLTANDSFNMSSFTDDGTGVGTSSYTNSMSNANYSVSGMSTSQLITQSVVLATGSFQYVVRNDVIVNVIDTGRICMSMDGDLA